MDPDLQHQFITLWSRFFPGEPLPITFEITADPQAIQAEKPQEKWRCLICDLARVRNGKNLVLGEHAITCGGGLRYSGYQRADLPHFDDFIASGIEGVVKGERYKRSPEIVKAWREDFSPIPSSGKVFLFKRWDKLEEADNPEVVIFFCKGEVLSGLFTLANFDRPDPYGVITPMGSGCSSILYYPWLEAQSPEPRAVLGMMDPSARPCVPADMLTFAVPMKRFITMIGSMEESFLITPAWEKVQKKMHSGSRTGEKTC